MSGRADVAVIGTGIVGLAHAWAAAKRGRSVVVFERYAKAELASVRNFGMIWPIGQPPGDLYGIAMRSRELWLELKAEAGVWLEECGSVHAVYQLDELRVIEEFAATAPDLGVTCELIPADEATGRFPVLNPNGLQGALHSPSECVVDPRQAMGILPQFLQERYGVQFHFRSAVTHVEMPTVRTASSDTWQVDRCLVCSGADFETLFPAVFTASGLVRCKLQMMSTGPQPNGLKLGPHVAGGLTLGHYKSFEVTDSLTKLKERIAETMPEYARYGIHVMASQNHLGEVIIGDSHEYNDDMSPFDNPRIDELILDYLRTLVRLPDPTIRRRWSGVYAKHPARTQFTAEPQPGCHVVASPGGAGMTMAFGLAERWWDRFE